MSKELSIRVAELFTPKPWKHDGVKCVCEKCGALYRGVNSVDTDQTCPVPDPIDITDLGKALECFRGFGLPTLLMIHIKGVFELYPHEVPTNDNLSVCFKSWILYEATAEQIWEICCLAKESE